MTLQKSLRVTFAVSLFFQQKRINGVLLSWKTNIKALKSFLHAYLRLKSSYLIFIGQNVSYRKSHYTNSTEIELLIKDTLHTQG